MASSLVHSISGSDAAMNGRRESRVPPNPGMPPTCSPASEPERIGVRHRLRPTARQLRDGPRLVEPDIVVELKRQRRLEIMASALCLRPVDDADRPLEQDLRQERKSGV